jgi:hypothetical protein
MATSTSPQDLDSLSERIEKIDAERGNAIQSAVLMHLDTIISRIWEIHQSQIVLEKLRRAAKTNEEMDALDHKTEWELKNRLDEYVKLFQNADLTLFVYHYQGDNRDDYHFDIEWEAVRSFLFAKNRDVSLATNRNRF